MNRKHFIFVIPLIALIAMGFLSGNAFSGPSGHYGIGGAAGDCNICHDFVNGIYGGGGVYGDPAPPLPPPGYNLRWIKSPIVYPSVISPNVEFFSFSGLADGVAPINGPCEVCHTTTKYYRNNGPGESHYSGNCVTCHPHFLEDIKDYFEPRFVGNQAHFTHFNDPKGPMLGSSSCYYNVGGCHNPSSFKKFGLENASLSTTAVCNACHSNGGVFNGVGNLGTCSSTTTTVCNEDTDCPPSETCNIDYNSVAYGAKANWEHGAYESVPSGFPSVLKEGKEDWCAGCHDNVPASSHADGTGVKAPNVMGNSSQTYGYNVNGHGPKGFVCADCHDLAVTHLDGEARTYSASASPNNYRAGYRLNEDMAVPRNGQIFPAAFKLCTNCHLYTNIIGSTSNFRDDFRVRNYHQMHLEWWPALICSDSDFDGPGGTGGCSSGTCKDSAMTCIICHNVHGANGNSEMIRHGELISSPGTTNKVPALDFHWYKADGVTQTTVYNDSRYGGLLCGIEPDISINHVCYGCHATGELKWNRTPGGPLAVTIEAVWASDYSDVTHPSFAPDANIRYHVRFTSNGPDPTYFMKSPGATSKVLINTTIGPYTKKLPKNAILAPGTYEWTWDDIVPHNAIRGSTASITVKINMWDHSGGTILSSNKKSVNFTITP